MKRLLTTLAVLLFCAPAFAQLRASKPTGTLVSAVTLDAASSAVTINGEAAQGFDLLILEFSLTDANDSVSAITMTCFEGGLPTDMDYAMQSCTVASGVCTSDNASWVKDPSGMTKKKWATRVDISGYRNVSCTITDTGGLIGDILTVKGYLATKG